MQEFFVQAEAFIVGQPLAAFGAIAAMLLAVSGLRSMGPKGARVRHERLKRQRQRKRQK